MLTVLLFSREMRKSLMSIFAHRGYSERVKESWNRAVTRMRLYTDFPDDATAVNLIFELSCLYWIINAVLLFNVSLYDENIKLYLCALTRHK